MRDAIVENCEIYSEIGVCKFCDSDYFLDDNECFELNLSTADEEDLEGCDYFGPDKTCLYCEG